MKIDEQINIDPTELESVRRHINWNNLRPDLKEQSIKESVQARYKIYAPCAVIAESRCLASKSFEQNSVKAPA